MAADDVLDNPAYHSLTGAYAGLALQSGRTRRYRPEVSPFAGFPPDPEPSDWNDLAAFPTATVSLLDPGTTPPGWTVQRTLDIAQMVLDREPASGSPVAELDATDVGDMLELVAQTNPGPFAPETIALGRYVGVRDGGRLVAMAGERMRPPGWTEVSAVCTAPSHRGQGLARRVMADVIGGITARGERVFLHVLAANASGIALYESMGFVHRRRLPVLVLARP